MMGETATAKLNVIPLSDNTVQRCISDMALDVKEQVLDGIRESPYFSIQIDQSTDVANCAQLMTYVRYIQPWRMFWRKQDWPSPLYNR